MLQIRLAFLDASLVVCVAFVPSGYGCTIFSVTQDARTYVAANEDWTTDRFYLQVQPAEGKNHGTFVFGVDNPEKYPFSGFNDQGLFFDLASASQAQAPKLDPKKETRDNRIYVRMLESCSYVTEAIEFLNRFNITGLQRHHIMVVDRDGLSAVMEGTPEGQVVIRKRGRYQLITNFLLSTAEDSRLPKSGRFAVADRMLTEMEKPTIEALRSILRETRTTSGRYPTVFSSIIDLSDLRLYLYYKGDFDKVVVLDMRKELERGKRVRRLTSSFSFLVPRGADHVTALTA